MRAVKENKVYDVNTESEKERYLKEGFDIYNDEGVIQEHSPKKKISYGEHIRIVEELTAENERLKAEIKKSGKSTPVEDQFTSMDVDALKTYALEHDIGIGNSTSQKGIADKIRAALQEK